MAGTIQCDYLQPTSSAGLTILTPSGNTVASINTSGVFSTTGSLMLSANGTIITSTYTTLTANTLQIGQSGSSSNNFTLYQPSTPDGTVRLGNGNAGSVTDLVTVSSTGNINLVNDLRWGTWSSGTSGQAVTATTSASGYVSMYTSGLERMRLDSSGNLGLGVTPSGASGNWRDFDIRNAAISARLSDGAVSLYSNCDSRETYLTTNTASNYYQVAGTHRWLTAPSGTAGNAISFTQAMTLDASGNLLLGKTSKNGVVGVNSPFSINLASIGSVAGGGTGAVDTGISINGGAAGGCIIFMASRNVGAGTQTSSAVYIITLYYDGNNAPAVAYVGGSTNFCTFGVSASNTLTVTNAGSGNASYSWIINK